MQKVVVNQKSGQGNCVIFAKEKEMWFLQQPEVKFAYIFSTTLNTFFAEYTSETTWLNRREYTKEI